MTAANQPPLGQPTRWLPRCLSLALLLVCVAVFANAVHSGLTYDDKYFTPDEVQWSLASVAQLFSEDAWAAAGAPSRLYRPLMWLLLWAEGALHGPRPLWFHLTCVALHAAATLLLFAVLRQVLALAAQEPPETTASVADSPALATASEGSRSWAAAAGALLFAVHPVHTEAINSIFNRSEILVTLAVLTALWLLLRRLLTRAAGLAQVQRTTWLQLAVIYLAALLCRESALSLPALVLLVVCGLRPALLLDRRQRRALWAALPWLLVPLVVYLALRSHALATRGGLLNTLPIAATPASPDGITPSWLPLQRIGPALCMLREGLRLLVYPQPLRASYDTLPGGGPLHALLFHGLLLSSALLAARTARPLLVALLFYYVALLPSTRPLSSDPIQSQMAERFLYLPSVALAMGSAFLVAEVLQRTPRRGKLAALTAVLAVASLFAVWSVRRNADWASSLSLWQAELRTTPHSVTALRLLTAAQIETGQAAAAVELCDAELPQHGQDARLQNHCAIAYDDRGRSAAAETAYRRAIALGLGAVAHANLARSLDRQGRSSEAQAQAELAIEAEVDPARRHYRRGLFLLRYHPQRRDETIYELRQALSLQPRFRAAQSALNRLLTPDNR